MFKIRAVGCRYHYQPVKQVLTEIATADRFVGEILVELENLHLQLFYKCTAKVVILIVTTKSFTYYFYRKMQNKSGYPVWMPENLVVW